MDLKLYCIRPHEDHPHTHTVIFLHGRGSTATMFNDDLLDSQNSRGRHLQDIFPSVRWVFAQADGQHSESLGREARQWFEVFNPGDLHARPELQVAGLRHSAAKLIQLIRNEAATVGGMRRVVLAGHCSGFTAAVHALLNLPDADHDRRLRPENRLGGLVGLSSWMALPAPSIAECRDRLGLRARSAGAAANEVDDDFYRSTPVLLCHSGNDDAVPVEEGRKLRDALRAFGMDVTYRECARGGHWVLHGLSEVDHVVEFLKAQGLPEYTPATKN